MTDNKSNTDKDLERYEQEKEQGKDYQTFMYKLDDNGEMESILVKCSVAKDYYNEGWRTTPAELLPDDHAVNTVPQAQAMHDTTVELTNLLANIDNCDSKETLRDVAENFLGIKMKPGKTVGQMRALIKSTAVRRGILPKGGKGDLNEKKD